MREEAREITLVDILKSHLATRFHLQNLGRGCRMFTSKADAKANVRVVDID